MRTFARVFKQNIYTPPIFVLSDYGGVFHVELVCVGMRTFVGWVACIWVSGLERIRGRGVMSHQVGVGYWWG